MKRLKFSAEDIEVPESRGDGENMEGSVEDIQMPDYELSGSCEALERNQDSGRSQPLAWGSSEVHERGITTANGENGGGQEIQYNQIHAFPSQDATQINELHIYIDNPLGDFPYDNAIKLMQLVGEGGEVHVHYIDTFLPIEIGQWFLQIPTYTKGRVISHVHHIESVTFLTAAMRADETVVTDFSRVELDHSEEMPMGSSAQDVSNNIDAIRTLVGNHLAELQGYGVLTASEAQEFSEKDKVLYISGTVLKQRIEDARQAAQAA